MAERALVTGGAGFVGLHLARRLLRDGVEVTLLDDFSRGRDDQELSTLRDDVRLVRHSLAEPIPPGLLAGTFDEIYHLAAIVGVRRSTDAPGQVLSVNIQAALHLLEWCRRHPPGRIFLSSTSEVADGAARLGVTSFPTGEQVPFVLPDPTLARSSYALSKIVAESLFRFHGCEFTVRIGRYHNVYGPRMGYDHVIPQFITRALDRTDPFPIYGAHQSRAFCHVDDAVAASIAVLRHPGTDLLVANIGNDTEEIVIQHLADAVVRLAGYQPRFRPVDPPPGSPDRRLPDLRVLRDTIGMRPSVDLDSGLRQTFAWYSTRPHSGSQH
jgi:UDP-glucose 4-epimerase/UDP-glucuronate decarboxylase